MKRFLYLFSAACFLLSCTHHDFFPVKTSDVIYIETNNYKGDQNAILAYRHLDNGMLEQIPGSPFYTNGNGIANLAQILGPDDSDTQLKISSDGKYLLAVNSGSHTIAVFRIDLNGALTPVPGSPFSSNGKNPVSIDVRDNYVYVVNKAQLQNPYDTIIDKPNYTVFTIDNNGVLSPVPSSSFETTPGTSPSQALVSNDGKFVFGDDFLGFMLPKPVGTLRSFLRDNSGKLMPVAGTPYFIPETGGALGLWQHPSQNILYVGFPLAAKFGVYAINASTGELNFKSSVDAGAAACWLRTTKNGSRLYVLNSGENTVSIYNTENASSPVSMGKLTLKNSGPIYIKMGMPFTTSEPFALTFSTDEKYLYVVNQFTNLNFSLDNYNYLHVLTVKADGNLDESAEPLLLPVPNIYRPQGIVVKRVHDFSSGTDEK